VARIGWGHVSDRWIDPTVLMGVLGLMMAVGIAALGLLPASAPWPLTLAVTMLCAATAVSWNGVFYADLVRHVPASAVAQATGATQFMTFLGGMTGGGVFAWLVGRTGSYASVYAGLAVLPAIAGALMLMSARRDRARAAAAR
jgi:nitrate/nitrite transporter NarK